MTTPSHVIETRRRGEGWQAQWRGASEAIAVQAAQGLSTERIQPPGTSLSLPRYAWVRVRRGKTVVWSCGPERVHV